MSIIILPRREFILPIRLKTEMKGFLRFQTINKFSGKVTYDTGFFPNKLLDNGLNNMAVQTQWLTACQVGRNSTPPNASQTALLDYFAGTSTIQSNITGSNGIAPYYGYRRITFRFAQGATNANLSEAGIGWNSASGDFLISRALIIDPQTQLPTTITPLPDEILDVTYELRYYPPENDVVGPQVTLNSIVYDTITRASDVTGVQWRDYIGQKISEYSPVAASWSAYDGTLGTVVQGPNGVSAASDNANAYNLAYANNSYELVMGMNVGPTGWNLGSGIRSIRILTTAGAFQSQFDANPGGASIPKNVSYTMVMEWILSWAEKV